jgi:hypothetical protein
MTDLIPEPDDDEPDLDWDEGVEGETEVPLGEDRTEEGLDDDE